jgi:hypothetical protein
VILKKAIRAAWGCDAGTGILVEERPEGVVLRPSRPSRLEDVRGRLRYIGRAKTLQAMEKAIAKGAKERRDRGRY